MKKIITYLLFFFLNLAFRIVSAQPPEYKLTQKEYIDKFKEDAVKEMLMYGIPASVTLAQGMLESGNGNSALAVYANNHFGIKCHEDWTGMTFIQDDDEKDECFRKYPSVLDSYNDHTLFLKSRDRYASLFTLKTTDYKAWAYGLKSAGYATDPKYAERLIDIIETNKLYEFDRLVILPVVKASSHATVKPLASKFSARIISLNNDRKYVMARDGDSYFRIANEFEMRLWQLFKYNDLEKNISLKSGEMVYLQPKRNKAKEEFHIVQAGETLHMISQKQGMKMKKLLRYNNMQPGQQPRPGDKLNLRKKKKS